MPTMQLAALHAPWYSRPNTGILPCTCPAGSFASAVDNVRALQSRMPQSLRKAWPVVWEESVMSWEAYGYVACSGMRRLLLHVNEETRTHLAGLKFDAKQGAQPAELGLVPAEPASDSAAAAPAVSGTAADSAATAGSTAGGAGVASAALQEIQLVDAVMLVDGSACRVSAGKDQAASTKRAAAGAAGAGSKVIEVTAVA